MTRVVVDTSGLERDMVLAAFYNVAAPRGLGFTHYDPRPMDAAGAHRVIHERGNDLLHVLHKLTPSVFPSPTPRMTLAFDYVYGRPLKLIIMNPAVDTTIYDSIHGEGMGATAIGILRDTGDPAHDNIMSLHYAAVRTAALQEWNDMPVPYRDEVLASYRRGDRPAGSTDHIIAGILWPTVN